MRYAAGDFDAGGGVATAGSLVDELLAEQGDLSAVERFAQFHEDVESHLQGRYYSSLLPASPPGPGQQLAFEVDLQSCSGCKACVVACHALNGLDEGEAWRDVGLLVGGAPLLPVIQHVTSSCHHCLEPACLAACPVDAYEKDPITGIVRHLDDQCFGCQYCTLACPYDAPKFHPGKGIVRKCDMCSDRLQAGEAPACVQACPHQAIRIRVVDVDEVRERAAAGDFIPGAFDPACTSPTTLYRSNHPRDLRPADEDWTQPEHAHAPLTVMLVLTQLAAGGFLVELVARLAGFVGVGTPLHLWIALGLGYVGLAASLLHLGRPFYAYRAILGIRHSWLSREVVALGGFAKLATAYVAADLLFPAWLASHPTIRLVALAAVTASGVAGVACSVMVYHAVRRPFWRAPISGVKFAGTAVVLGLAVALASLSLAEAATGAPPLMTVAAVLMLATSAKLAFESGDLRGRDGSEPLRKTAWLLRNPLKGEARRRRICGLAGGLILPTVVAFGDGWAASAAAVCSLVGLLLGELIERDLFFRAVVRPKMPGGLS